MIQTLVRAILALAGIITSWFLAKDAGNFEIFQMIVGLALIILFMALAAFWPSIVVWFRNWRSRRAKAQ